ncbi:MAG: esterase-like activity of phytase family protein [Hyphomicrobiales bacterium]
MSKFFNQFSLITAAALLSSTAFAADIKVTTIAVPTLPLENVVFKGGKKITLDVGIGSGAVHFKNDPENVFYTITDRGPNIKCSDAQEILGQDAKSMCAGDEKSKIFPIPDFAPLIVKWQLDGDKANLVEKISLTGLSGKPMSGLTNGLTITNTEKSYSNMGELINFTANGLDTEGIVKLTNGNFWVSEEYGGSIALLAPNGKVLERHVPKGMAIDLTDADYKVVESLPAIIAKRKLNRGIESLTISADETTLYFAMQSPLSNPNVDAHKKSRNVRIFAFNIEQQKTVGEYLYLLDKPETFIKDFSQKKRVQKDIKISEMIVLENEKMLVLERISNTTKYYLVDLAKAVNVDAKFDDITTSPSLEQTDPENLSPVAKELVFNSDDLKGLPSKTEGIAMLNDHELLLVNDNDFGIDGKAVSMVKLTFPTKVIDYRTK